VNLSSSIVRVAPRIGFLIVLGVILVTGLWPLNPIPANGVSWIKGQCGLRFYRNPVVRSDSPFQLPNPRAASVSLEIWIKPSRESSTNAFFSIYTPENPLQFRLMHYIDGMLVRRNVRDSAGRRRQVEIELDNIFRPNVPIFITVTAGTKGTSVYLDSELAEESPHFGLTQKDLSGELIMGASPLDRATWYGELKGLAIYTESLSPMQISAHYQMWIQGRVSEIVRQDHPAALYDFSEGSGRTVHNRGSGAPDLIIPKYFVAPHKRFLELPWNEFHPEWSYVTDIMINVAGFVPLGVLTYALLLGKRPPHRAAWMTVLVGAFTSVTVEVLQGFIPTRSSGMTDILTNTAGTAIGVLVCILPGPKHLLASLKNVQRNEEYRPTRRTEPEANSIPSAGG
jgi:hypothetical protein